MNLNLAFGFMFLLFAVALAGLRIFTYKRKKPTRLGRFRTCDSVSVFTQRVNEVLPSQAQGVVGQQVNQVTSRNVLSGIVAHAGGGQANATPLTAPLNIIATVASPGNSVLLPSATGFQVGGPTVTVINNGANAANVYPSTGDQINGLGANNPFSIAPGQIITFTCTAANQWNTGSASNSPGQPLDAYNTNAGTSGLTLTAANISGGNVEVSLNMTGALGAGANAQLPTVAALVAVLTNPVVGGTYKLRIINSSSGNFAWTVTTNTGWTLNGTMTIAQNTWRDFYITINTATTATLQSIGTGTFS